MMCSHVQQQERLLIENPVLKTEEKFRWWGQNDTFRKCKHKELVIIRYSSNLSRIISELYWNSTPFRKNTISCDGWWWPDELIPASGNCQTSPKDVQMACERTAVISPSENHHSLFWLLCFPRNSGQQDEDWLSCQEMNAGVRLWSVGGELSGEVSSGGWRGRTWALFLLKRPAAVGKKPFSDLPLWSWWTAVPPEGGGGVASNCLRPGCVCFLQPATRLLPWHAAACRCLSGARGRMKFKSSSIGRWTHQMLISPPPMGGATVIRDEGGGVCSSPAALITCWLEVQLLLQRRQNVALWDSGVDDSGVRVVFSQLYKPLPVTHAGCDLPTRRWIRAYSPGRACEGRAETHKHVAEEQITQQRSHLVPLAAQNNSNLSLGNSQQQFT